MTKLTWKNWAAGAILGITIGGIASWQLWGKDYVEEQEAISVCDRIVIKATTAATTTSLNLSTGYKFISAALKAVDEGDYKTAFVNRETYSSLAEDIHESALNFLEVIEDPCISNSPRLSAQAKEISLELEVKRDKHIQNLQSLNAKIDSVCSPIIGEMRKTISESEQIAAAGNSQLESAKVSIETGDIEAYILHRDEFFKHTSDIRDKTKAFQKTVKKQCIAANLSISPEVAEGYKFMTGVYKSQLSVFKDLESKYKDTCTPAREETRHYAADLIGDYAETNRQLELAIRSMDGWNFSESTKYHDEFGRMDKESKAKLEEFKVMIKQSCISKDLETMKMILDSYTKINDIKDETIQNSKLLGKKWKMYSKIGLNPGPKEKI